MIFKSPVFSQASGSIAGIVYSRNAGGMYVRSRANPTNPNTAQQQAVRDAFRTIVDSWTNNLSPGQREGWNTYAFNTPTLNNLGEATSKSGQQMYIRSNVARLQAGLTIVNNAPNIFDLSSFTPIADPTADASAGDIDFTFTNTDEWANEDGGAMLIYQSRPQNPTRTFGKGPYQLLTVILGDAMTPPTSPVTAIALFPMAADQRIFFKVNVTRADGRYTSPQQPTTLVIP